MIHQLEISGREASPLFYDLKVPLQFFLISTVVVVVHGHFNGCTRRKCAGVRVTGEAVVRNWHHRCKCIEMCKILLRCKIIIYLHFKLREKDQSVVLCETELTLTLFLDDR